MHLRRTIEHGGIASRPTAGRSEHPDLHATSGSDPSSRQHPLTSDKSPRISHYRDALFCRVARVERAAARPRPAIPWKRGHFPLADSCNFASSSEYRTPVHLWFLASAWRRARAHRTRRARGRAGRGLPVFPAGGAAVVSGVKAGPAGAAAGRRCAAALRPEGRPRTLKRRVPPPGTRQPSEGERRSRLLVPGRAAAGRAHAASRPAASSQATGDIMPKAECRRLWL